MNWLLIIVAAIIIINALIGRKVGFIKTVFSMVSITIAIILTIWISPNVNKALSSNETFYKKITQGIDKMLTLQMEDQKQPDEISIISELPIPKSLKESLLKNNTKENYTAMAIGSFKEYINTYLTNIVINAISFILTFLIALTALWVLSIMLNIISKLPLLNTVNKTAGLAVGFIQGLVIVWVLFIFLTAFSGLTFGATAMEMIEESKLLSILYNNNLLLGFVIRATMKFI